MSPTDIFGDFEIRPGLFLEYGFYVDGEYNFYGGDVFDKNKCLLDPYAKLVSGRNIWGAEPDWNNPFQYRSKVILDDFDR